MVFALQFSGQSFYQVKSLSNRVEIASCFQIRLFSHVCKYSVPSSVMCRGYQNRREDVFFSCQGSIQQIC